MAAYSAFLRGASRIYVVDRVPERLAAAKKIPGCTPVDFSTGEDAVDVIIRENDGKMVDRSIDAVGYQAVGSGKESGEVPNVVLEQCIKVTRPTGGIGVPGLYVPSDPGAVDEKSSMGMMLMSFGKLFEKVSLPFVSKYPCLHDANRCMFEGSYNQHWSMQRKEIQPILARYDNLGAGGSKLCCLARNRHR